MLIDLMEQARRLNLFTLHGQATAIDRATPYYAWRDVLGQLLQPHGARLRPDLLTALGRRARNWHLGCPSSRDVTPLGLRPQFAHAVHAGLVARVRH